MMVIVIDPQKVDKQLKDASLLYVAGPCEPILTQTVVMRGDPPTEVSGTRTGLPYDFLLARARALSLRKLFIERGNALLSSDELDRFINE